MDERKRSDLSRYRFERANEEIAIAKDLLHSGRLLKSANSSYYAMFHAVRSALALEGFDAKKHSTVISHFGQNYVKTGIFPSGTTSIIWDAFHIRRYSDYEDYYELTPEQAQEQIDKAESILRMIHEYLESCRAEIEAEIKKEGEI